MTSTFTSPGCRSLATWLIAACIVFSGCATAKPSSLWEEYVLDPDRHPNLPNASYAGYRYGEVEIPHIAGPVYNVVDFGAVGDGETAS